MNTELPSNYLGAAIFWAYILAALGLTAVVGHTLIHLPQTQDGRSGKRSRLTRVFSGLAALSFSTLSFNMLNVLIQSYLQWSDRVSNRYKRERHGILQGVWTWSITSNLFRDFSEAIVADQGRYLWVVSALLATMSVCLYMSTEGRRCGIPRLWAFFAWSQILPISFAQNLFYIALIRQPRGAQPVDIRPISDGLVLAAYSLSLAIAPCTAQTSALMPLIIVARILLLAPLLLIQTGTETTCLTRSRRLQTPFAVVAGLLIARQAFLALEDNNLTDFETALLSHPAVSSLGCDLIICAVSSAAWMHQRATLDDVPPSSKRHS